MSREIQKPRRNKENRMLLTVGPVEYVRLDGLLCVCVLESTLNI